MDPSTLGASLERWQNVVGAAKQQQSNLDLSYEGTNKPPEVKCPPHKKRQATNTEYRCRGQSMARKMAKNITGVTPMQEVQAAGTATFLENAEITVYSMLFV